MQWTKQEFEKSREILLTTEDASLVADCRLGRRVNSKRRAYRSYRSQSKRDHQSISTNTFVPPSNPSSDVRTLSVDCMGVVPDEQIAQVARKQLRQSGKVFFGWYVLTVEDIYDIKCTLKISPTPENRYHADIILPVDPASKLYRDELKQVVNDLAARASFVPYGSWIDDVDLGL